MGTRSVVVVTFGLCIAACTNDYQSFTFADTGGAGSGGQTKGGAGGTSSGGKGGAVTGGGGPPTGGGGRPTGGGGSPTGGGGSSGCSGSQIVCSSACVDIATDVQNCGYCEQPCPQSFTCNSGFCRCPSAALCGNEINVGCNAE